MTTLIMNKKMLNKKDLPVNYAIWWFGKTLTREYNRSQALYNPAKWGTNWQTGPLDPVLMHNA